MTERNAAALSLRLRLNDVARIGPGKIALLEAAIETGSLEAAGARLNMSQRRAALLVDALNEAFDTAVIEIGAERAVVTAFGRELVLAYRRVETETEASIAAHFQAISQRLRKAD